MLLESLNLPGTGRARDDEDGGVLPDDLRKAIRELKEQATRIGGSGMDLEEDMISQLCDLEGMIDTLESEAYNV